MFNMEPKKNFTDSNVVSQNVTPSFEGQKTAIPVQQFQVRKTGWLHLGVVAKTYET